MEAAVHEHLASLARTPRLLVACDYDGTLAELTPDFRNAGPDPRALAALRALAGVAWTSVAVLSGRAYGDLERFLGPGPEARVGSHGAEWMGPGRPLSREAAERLAMVVGVLRGLEGAGVAVEVKPASACLHYRSADAEVAASAVSLAVERAGRLPGVSTRYGSAVVEFMVVPAGKGAALARLKHAAGATAVLFAGDDLTDEEAFRDMSAGDLSVKIGAGPTAARVRVRSVGAVAEMLEELAALRRGWASSRGITPLSGCAVLSDQRTMAVVSPGARVSWLCVPRLDSPALFASLLDGPGAGSFDVGPPGGGAPRSVSYDGASLVLVTSWDGLTVTDYLDASGGRAYQKAGRTDLVRAVSGRAVVRFAPRLDFGRVPTRIRVERDGLVVEGTNEPVVLHAPGVSWRVEVEGPHHTAVAEVVGSAVLELRYGTGSLRAASEGEPARRAMNARFWSGWASSLTLPPVFTEEVRRSALVLKALCHGPTGAVAAAATTSLPECLGGVRNWDYRFCWPRDAALSAAALVRLGNTGHALKLMDWLVDVVDRAESPDRLRPIYTLSGSLLPPEAELSHLSGYADSRPVRVGNAAANQVQLDVFGPIVQLAAMLAARGAPIAPDHWRLVRAMARAVLERWREPDHGIWEVRLDRRHHVHSKVMCWHTLEGALAVEEAVTGGRNAEWESAREEIRAEVLSRGWSGRARAFTAAYGSDELDAASLAVGLTGLLDWRDPRWAATVDAVAGGLRRGGTVRRYLSDDGLAGPEGGMHVCTGWLAEAMFSLGRRAEGMELLGELARAAGPLGVMTEQLDPETGLAVGNLAQAYSHLALINAAVAAGQGGGGS